MIRINFQSGESVNVLMSDNAATKIFRRMIKHLQHVPLQHYLFDNPYCWNKEIAVKELVKYAHRLQINIDADRLHDQQYLNLLHKDYERSYNGSSDWLHFHEAVHVCEHLNRDVEPLFAHIDYREAAGPLNIPVTAECLESLTTDLTEGTCYIDWTELGKTPYNYWKNGEPNDINRICTLAKPWINLKPKLKISLKTHDAIPSNVEEFELWFAMYKDQWCKHWKLADYTNREIFGRLPIGHIDDINKFKDLLKLNDRIVSLKLNVNSNTLGT